MFHLDEFGAYSESLQEFADRDGYIPEEGDSPDEFIYDDREETILTFKDHAEDEWAAFVERAVEATRRLEQTLYHMKREGERLTVSYEPDTLLGNSTGCPGQIRF